MINKVLRHGLNRIWRAVGQHKAGVLFLALLLACALPSPTVSAQNEPGQNDQTGFAVRKESQNVIDDLADFERYRDKKQWEKAFAALGKVSDAQHGGLVRDKDGLFIPTDLKIRDELLSLPPAGREAYRLFNDPKAQQLLNNALDSAADATGRGATAQTGADDVAALRTIVDKYFITSVGDKAADRLGDALFETGEFTAAERCWRMIVDSYPDTGLSVALLQTKRGIALARAGLWSQFDAVRALVHERFAGQTVRIGGKDVVAPQYLDELASGAPATTAPAVAAGPKASTFLDSTRDSRPTTLPSSDTPVWQIPLMDQVTSDRINQQLSQMGWGGMAAQLTDIVPATALDEKRVYVNWMGSCFAADLVTGKMLWRTNPFIDFGNNNFQQMIMQGQLSNMSGEVEVVGDRLVIIKGPQPNPQGNQQVNLMRLSCLATDTGKTVWTSEGGAAPLSDSTFVGKPLIVDDAIYVCSFPQQTPAMSLMCIGLAKGELRWQVELGNAVTTQDFRGTQLRPCPVLLMRDGIIYVLTNNGALLAVSPVSHQIQWAFAYGAVVEQQQQFFWNNATRPPPTLTGAMLPVGSTLYFKETNGEMLYAMDLTTPAVKWKRPIDASVTLVGGDDQNLFVLGTEIDCINVESREMVWSDRLAIQSADILPLLFPDRIDIFDERGVHEVRTANGDTAPVFRGYDRDSLGGDLSRTADRFITISSVAITAYPLNPGERP